MEPLSGRQQQILDVVSGYIRRNGYAPSIRDICKATGLTSTSTVAFHLNTLEARGFIRRGAHGHSRALAVVEQAAS